MPLPTQPDPQLLRRHRLVNWLQSLLMLGGMTLLLYLLGWLIGGETLALNATLVAVFVFVLGPTLSSQTVVRLYGARPLHPQEAPQLQRVVETLARRARLPGVPRLYYLPSRILNAFTVGRPHDAAIVVTDGLLRRLDGRELQGVLAHEISHIVNRDTWVMGIADVISRTASLLSSFGQVLLLLNLPLILVSDASISWLAIFLLVFTPNLAALLQLALSRTREFDADLGAVLLTGDPRGLAAALAKLEWEQQSLAQRLLIPGARRREPSLLRSHPATRERIRRLLEYEESLRGEHPPPLLEGPLSLHLPPTLQAPRRRRGGFWY